MTKQRKQDIEKYTLYFAIFLTGLGAVLGINAVNDSRPKFKQDDCVHINNKRPNIQSVIRIINYNEGQNLKSYRYVQILPKTLNASGNEYSDYSDANFIESLGTKVDCKVIGLINLGTDK